MNHGSLSLVFFQGGDDASDSSERAMGKDGGGRKRG